MQLVCLDAFRCANSFLISREKWFILCMSLVNMSYADFKIMSSLEALA